MTMLARPILRAARRAPLNGVRYNSSASEAASKAKDTASKTASKAAEGLSRVTSAAGPAISGAAKGIAGSLSKVGGRTGKVVNFIEQQIPFVVHYTKVGIEVAKIVSRGQQMSPPSVATFQSVYESAWQAIRRPRALIESVTKSMQPAQGGRLRISNAQLATAGVVFAECLGFFTVGEMIGRFKLVGYHGEPAAAGH
ncbi:hypothetical protein VUR80DRAFT_5593 [Thermomyces stellatus]